MGDASGVKAAQRDQGEARRSGVISRRLRRLTSAFASHTKMSRMKMLQGCSCYLLFPVVHNGNCNLGLLHFLTIRFDVR